MQCKELMHWLCQFPADMEVELPTTGGMTRWLRIQEHNGHLWISPAMNVADDGETPYYFDADDKRLNPCACNGDKEEEI